MILIFKKCVRETQKGERRLRKSHPRSHCFPPQKGSPEEGTPFFPFLASVPASPGRLYCGGKVEGTAEEAGKVRELWDNSSDDQESARERVSGRVRNSLASQGATFPLAQ